MYSVGQLIYLIRQNETICTILVYVKQTCASPGLTKIKALNPAIIRTPSLSRLGNVKPYFKQI